MSEKEMPQVTNHKVSQRLPVTLTEDQVVAISKDIARHVQEKGEMEADLKEIKESYKGRITKKENEIVSDSRKIQDGYQYEDVECEWIFYWTTGDKKLYRKDTGEFVREERISETERQSFMFEQERKGESEPEEEGEE